MISDVKVRCNVCGEYKYVKISHVSLAEAFDLKADLKAEFVCDRCIDG